MEKYSHITKQENTLNQQTELLERLNNTLDDMESHWAEYKELAEYYYSDRRMQDLEDDENHRIPETLPRGVLSEDGIYNLFADYYGTAVRMLEVAARILKER